MSIEDIKSPLPARDYNIPEEERPGDVSGDNSNRVAQINNPVSTGGGGGESQVTPEVKKSKKGLFVGGVGIALLLLGFLGYKFLLPMLAPKEPEKVRLVYWGIWEEDAVIQSAIADYTAKNPHVEIVYKKNEPIDYRTRLKGRLLKSPDEVEVPDIFRIHNTWVQGFREELAPVPAGTVSNLQLDTDFFDVYKENLIVSGSYRAVPIMYDGMALFYNKDLIEAAAVKLPKTWWGLEAAAKKLTVKDENNKIQVSGVAMGLAENVDHWSDIVGLMLMQNGVDLAVNDEVTNKKLTDVLTYYTIFRTKHEVWDETLPSSTEFFANGKLAFYFGPSWRVFNFNDMNPSLRFEVTTVPQLPTLEGAELDQIESSETNENITNIHWASYWVEGVNVRGKNQEEAWKFLEHLAGKESLEKMYKAASDMRAFGEIYPRKSMADKIATNPKIKPFVSAANNATSWYLCSRTADSSGVNEEMAGYFKDAINSITQKNQAPESVVGDLRNGINQLVLKYQIKKK